MGKLIKIVAKRRAMGDGVKHWSGLGPGTRRALTQGPPCISISLSLSLSLSDGLNCPLKEPPGANNCCHSRFCKATSRGSSGATTITLRTAVLACDCHYAERRRWRQGDAGGTSWLTSWPIKVHCAARKLSWQLAEIRNKWKTAHWARAARRQRGGADVHKWLMTVPPPYPPPFPPLFLLATLWWPKHFCVIS